MTSFLFTILPNAAVNKREYKNYSFALEANKAIFTYAFSNQNILGNENSSKLVVQTTPLVDCRLAYWSESFLYSMSTVNRATWEWDSTVRTMFNVYLYLNPSKWLTLYSILNFDIEFENLQWQWLSWGLLLFNFSNIIVMSFSCQFSVVIASMFNDL